LRRTPKNKTRKTNEMKCYKVMALPVLRYGSGTWAIKTKDMSKIQATEMRYLRSVKDALSWIILKTKTSEKN
jgi:hypothetical protein